jgi:hypothetical protein
MGKRRRGKKMESWNPKGVPNIKRGKLMNFVASTWRDKRLCFDDDFPQS